MTVNDEQPRVGAVPREAAESFEPPNLDALCERAERLGLEAPCHR